MKMPNISAIFRHRRTARVCFAILASVLVLEPLLTMPEVARATATTGFVRLDRMATSQTTSGTVCLNPQTAGTVGKVVVTFPGSSGSAGAAAFGINQTFGNWTVTTSNLPTGSSAWTGIGTATAVSGGSVTFASGAITTGTLWCFNFAAQLATPTSAGTNFQGSIQTQTSGGAPIDTTYWATSIVANDQVVVTASVSATFSMSLSANAAALGNLPTSGNPATAAVTMTASTNANNGWLAWVKNTGANSTLTSVTTSDTSISSGAFTTGAGNVHSLSSAAGYGMSAAAGSGSPSIATEYTGSSTSFGSLDSTKFEQFASKSTAVSGSTVVMTFGAEAAGTTKAASDYTDTVTVTAAGQF